MIKLHVPPETVYQIIQLLRSFQAETDITVPDDSGSMDSVEIRALLKSNPAIAYLEDLLAEMNDRQRAELVSLMWVGRGDYSEEDWEQAIEDACAEHVAIAANYLLSHPTVAEDMEEGMTILGYEEE